MNQKPANAKSCCLVSVGIFALICVLGVMLSVVMPKSANDSKDSLPKISEIQSKYNYNYYEAYTFSYRHASVKASIAGDTYWMQFYAKHWDKYGYDKEHPNRLSQARFWQIMEHADREAHK